MRYVGRGFKKIRDLKFIKTFELGVLPAQKKQACDRKNDTQRTFPGGALLEQNDTGNSHDRCASGQDGWHSGEWAAALEQQEERNRADADTDACER